MTVKFITTNFSCAHIWCWGSNRILWAALIDRAKIVHIFKHLPIAVYKTPAFLFQPDLFFKMLWSFELLILPSAKTSNVWTCRHKHFVHAFELLAKTITSMESRISFHSQSPSDWLLISSQSLGGFSSNHYIIKIFISFFPSE